jgi:ABC-type sugar transport system substrate-binding protein
MKRRVAKRRKRGRLVVTLILACAAVLVAAAVWRCWPTLFSEPRSEPRQVEQPKPGALPKSGGEDFSAAERQGLEDVLKRHGAGKQQ